jgi:elongation factor P
MSMIKAGNIKKGSYILYNGKPHAVISTQFVSPGKGSAFTRVKMRNLDSGVNIEFNFKSHDSVDELDIESHEMQYLYDDGEDIVFMNPQTYEQVNVPAELLGKKAKMLTSEIKVYVMFYQEKAIGVSLPPKVKMKVAEAQDAVAGDRQTAGKKPVEMETGLVIQAPLFVKTGDVLVIDTETAEYVSRAN